MSIKIEEEILFNELRKLNPDAVLDGVVDEKQYLMARYQIVYLLKEVNGGKAWDLRDYVYDGGRTQTWDNIARWTEGILNWEREIAWDLLERNNEERRLTYLKMIAAINLKKISGGHTSNGDEIYQAAIENNKIIKEQLRIYKPTIVICCGTEKPFIDACYQGIDINWKMTSRGVWFFVEKNMLVISFSHPEARVRDAYLYYALIDAVREIMSERMLK